MEDGLLQSVYGTTMAFVLLSSKYLINLVVGILPASYSFAVSKGCLRRRIDRVSACENVYAVDISRARIPTQ